MLWGRECGHNGNTAHSMGLYVVGKQSSTDLYKSIREWNSFSLGRKVRGALPPGSRGSSSGPFSLGWAEAHQQPNHRLCGPTPEPFSVSLFHTDTAGGCQVKEIRKLIFMEKFFLLPSCSRVSLLLCYTTPPEVSHDFLEDSPTWWSYCRAV